MRTTPPVLTWLLVASAAAGQPQYPTRPAPGPPQYPTKPAPAAKDDGPPAGYPPAPAGYSWVRDARGPDGWGLAQSGPATPPPAAAPVARETPRPFVPGPGTTPATSAPGAAGASTGSPGTTRTGPTPTYALAAWPGTTSPARCVTGYG